MSGEKLKSKKKKGSNYKYSACTAGGGGFLQGDVLSCWDTDRSKRKQSSEQSAGHLIITLSWWKMMTSQQPVLGPVLTGQGPVHSTQCQTKCSLKTLTQAAEEERTATNDVTTTEILSGMWVLCCEVQDWKYILSSSKHRSLQLTSGNTTHFVSTQFFYTFIFHGYANTCQFIWDVCIFMINYRPKD